MFEVLLVDDEPSVIQLLKDLIDWQTLGFTICGTASNGEEALEILKRSNPHLAIVDIRMPKVNGLQLLQQASEVLYLRTKFIISSAYSDFEYAKTAMRYGVSDYILKPIDDEEMLPALKKVRKQIEEEIDTLESEANKIKFAVSNYINRIIKDDISEELVEKCNRILNVKRSDLVKCALVEINQFETWMDDFEDIEIQMRRLSVRKVIEEVIGSEHLFKIFDEDIHRFGIILTRDMINKDRQFLENLKRIIDQNCQCSVSVALSEEGKGINNLEELYRQAALALQYRLFQKDEGVLYYEQFKNLPLNYCFYESDPDELLKDITSNNTSGINDKINTVFREFYEKKCAPQVIANYIKNIEFQLVKHVQEHKGNAEEIIRKLEKLNVTIGKTTITSLRDEFYRITLCISDYYKSISNKSSRDIIIDIKDFVHKNYQKDLKLQQIAKDYYVNPVYLGQVFAKTVGMHFNEYLHSVRIEEAKKLLRRTNVKISAIALMVGYSDSEYFVSKFKAAVHQLPSDYRRKHQDKNS